MTSKPKDQVHETEKMEKKTRQKDFSSEGEILDAEGYVIAALSESEKRVRDAVIKVVMNEINPLLEHLQKLTSQAINSSAEAQAKRLEEGIKEKIEKRMQKISSVMASRGV